MSRRELRQLLEDAMRSWWFRFGSRGSVDNVEIIRITSLDAGSVEYHGLADIEPREKAIAVVKRLKRSKLRGQRVDACSFQVRSAYRDRRGHKPHEQDLAVLDRRKRDRRRSNLIIERARERGSPTGISRCRHPVPVVSDIFSRTAGRRGEQNLKDAENESGR